MILVDVNVLLYAVNRDAKEHGRVRTWWEDILSGDQPVGLAWVTLLGFLRLATNPRVFAVPLSVEEAISRVDTWLSHANVRIVVESATHWSVLRDLLGKTGASGNLTTDAHLASLAISIDATLASCDGDFSRYARLRWINPAAVP